MIIQNKLVGKELKKLRNSFDISQREVSEDSGVSIKTIQRYELGYSEIKLTTLQKILQCYSMNLDFFVKRCEKQQLKF